MLIHAQFYKKLILKDAFHLYYTNENIAKLIYFYHLQTHGMGYWDQQHW